MITEENEEKGLIENPETSQSNENKENKNDKNLEQDEQKQKDKRKVNLKNLKFKQVRNIICIILFNLIFPYILYLISNISNSLFFEIREARRTVSIYNFSFFYELIIIYGFYFLFKSIFKKSLKSNIAVSVLFNLIQIISFYKINSVDKPLWPEDILLIGNVTEIAGYGNIKFEAILLLQVFITALILIIQCLITKYSKYEGNLKNITRIIIGIVSIIVLCIACCFNWTTIRGFEEGEYNSKANYSMYGATVEFFRNAYRLIEKPKLDIYNIERLEQIKQKSLNLEDNNLIQNDDSPDIIAIMAESFSDIAQLDSLQFNQDPLPTYRELIKNHPHGNTVVSIIGGETSMSEFEFLTGSSTKFLNGKKYPYSQIVKSNTISVASVLKENGYYTTAIHANDGSFYNRNNAYRCLGFDKIIFKEDMQNIDNVYENCVSDMDTAEEIVDQYENMQSDKKFIFTVTIETHLPYSYDKYPEKVIEVKPTKVMPATEVLDIETYSQGINNFDKALKYLTDYFTSKDEKVMIVLFGDHLPAFKTIYEMEFGDSIKKYETPYLIWTNYDMTQEEIEKYSRKQISLAGLSMMTLEAANIDMPWYYDFINELYKHYPVCTNKFLIDEEGNEVTVNTNNELIEDYNIIIFDILYEKNIET